MTTILQHPKCTNNTKKHNRVNKELMRPLVRERCKFTRWAGNPEWWGSSRMSLWGDKNLRKLTLMGRGSWRHNKSKYHSDHLQEGGSGISLTLVPGKVMKQTILEKNFQNHEGQGHWKWYERIYIGEIISEQPNSLLQWDNWQVWRRYKTGKISL